MRTCYLKIARLLASLAPIALVGAPDELATKAPKIEFMDESYVFSITDPLSERLQAQFRVMAVDGHEIIHRVVTYRDGLLLDQLLSSEESAILLKRFRSFDWNVKPKEKPMAPYFCAYGGPVRIVAFKALVEGTARQIATDAIRVPALADLIETIVSRGPETTGTSVSK